MVTSVLFPSRLGLGKPAPAQLLLGNTRQVGLDIEDRRAIQHVHASDVQIRAFPAKQFNRGQGNWIRASRGAGREYTMLTTRISRRTGDQIEIYRTVELPDNRGVSSG